MQFFSSSFFHTTLKLNGAIWILTAYIHIRLEQLFYRGLILPTITKFVFLKSLGGQLGGGPGCPPPLVACLPTAFTASQYLLSNKSKWMGKPSNHQPSKPHQGNQTKPREPNQINLSQNPIKPSKENQIRMDGKPPNHQPSKPNLENQTKSI